MFGPRFTPPEQLEWSMRLPSGEPGLQITGHPVVVRVDRSLTVSVHSPSSDRVIAQGAMNLGDVFWAERGELCETALAMVGATTSQALRALAYMGATRWAAPARRWEVAHA